MKNTIFLFLLLAFWKRHMSWVGRSDLIRSKSLSQVTTVSVFFFPLVQDSLYFKIQLFCVLPFFIRSMKSRHQIPELKRAPLVVPQWSGISYFSQLVPHSVMVRAQAWEHNKSQIKFWLSHYPLVELGENVCSHLMEVISLISEGHWED